MVDSLGFETDQLELAILAHEQHLDPSLGKDLQRTVVSGVEEYDEGRNQLLDDPEAILYRFEYDPTDHLEDLNWALEYWRGDREPKPTTNEAKCRSCPFSDICADSLV